MGLTIIAEKEETLKVNFEKGDSICLLGIPKVGQEVLEDIKEENPYADLSAILSSNE